MSVGRGMFARSDIQDAAETFVWVSLKALGLVWELNEIEAEATALTDRAFGWRDEQRAGHSTTERSRDAT